MNFQPHTARQIGKGNFGVVYAVQTTTFEWVAVKVISKNGRSPAEISMLYHECSVMGIIRDHPNILRIIEWYNLPNEVVIITELAKCDLAKILELRFKFTEDEARPIIKKIVAGLFHLHMNNIVHRDIKPENVLVGHNEEIKLSDFGLSVQFGRDPQLRSEPAGTIFYMAPEITNLHSTYDYRVDLWSLGVTAFQLLTGHTPFSITPNLNRQQQLEQIKTDIKTKDIDWPTNLSIDCKDFLERLLKKNPEDRLSWQDIHCHPFLFTIFDLILRLFAVLFAVIYVVMITLYYRCMKPCRVPSPPLLDCSLDTDVVMEEVF